MYLIIRSKKLFGFYLKELLAQCFDKLNMTNALRSPGACRRVAEHLNKVFSILNSFLSGKKFVVALHIFTQTMFPDFSELLFPGA